MYRVYFYIFLCILSTDMSSNNSNHASRKVFLLVSSSDHLLTIMSQVELLCILHFEMFSSSSSFGYDTIAIITEKEKGNRLASLS